MPFTFGALIGFILGVVLMLFLWASCNNLENQKAKETGIIKLGDEFYYIVKIKEENKDEQN